MTRKNDWWGDIPMKYTKIFPRLCVEEGLSLLAENVNYYVGGCFCSRFTYG